MKTNYLPSELAKLTGMSVQGITAMIRDGRIPAEKISGRWYIPAAWVLPILPPDHPDKINQGQQAQQDPQR